MYRLVIATLIVLIALPAWAAEEPKSEEQKTLYAIGLIVARQLSVFNLSSAEFEQVQQGLKDGIDGRKPLVDMEVYTKKTQELAVARRDAIGEKLVAEAKVFVEKAAREKGAIKTDTGLIYLSLKEGSGASPVITDRVKVNYRGSLVDGKEFDSSYKRGQPAEFAVTGVVKCWTEALQMMKPGGKAKLVCPPDIAYGKGGAGIIPANATLVFEVELLEVKK